MPKELEERLDEALAKGDKEDAAKRLERKCGICDGLWSVHWCDQHGVAACNHCGAPYRLYFYEGQEGQQKRVDKPPELLIREDWRGWTKALWKEKKTNIAPGFFCFPGSSYDVSTREDHEALAEWEKVHPDPKEFAESVSGVANSK